MKLARTLYVLTALALATPALAVDGADHHARHGRAAATPSTHVCEMHGDGKGPQGEQGRVSRAPVSPDPVFSDAG